MNPQNDNWQKDAIPVHYPGGDSSVNDNATVQSYATDASQGQGYQIESLEDEPNSNLGQSSQSADNVPRHFSLASLTGRKALVISVLITVIVLLFTLGSMSLLVRQGPGDKQKNAQTIAEQQDIKIEDALTSDIPKELQGAEQSLLVNGDVITRGNLKISNSGYVTIIKVQNPSANQTFTLPEGTGTICVDTNNCNYAGLDDLVVTQDQLTTLQGQVGDMSALLSELEAKTPPAGVDTLNAQRGAVSIQGSLNRINVSTSNGVVTLSTPQNLDANANVQFGSLTVSQAGQIRANTLVQTGAGNSININANNDMITFTAGGRVFQLPNSGGASQTICTTGASCASGGGTAVLLADGAAQTDSSGNASIYINDTGGGNLLQLQSGGVDRLTVTTNGNATVSGSLTVSSLGNGFVRSTAGALSVVSSINLASADVTGTLAVSNGGTGLNTIPANGVLVGNGTSPVSSVTAGGAGLCLVSTAGAPSFQACPGVGSSFNVAGTSGTPQQIDSGDTLTIAAGNNVTTTAGATDTVTVGTVNNPNFTTSVSTPLLQSSGALAITPGGALTVGAVGQTALLQGSTTTITSTGAGNDIVLTPADRVRISTLDCTGFANGGVLTTDVSGNVSCADDNGDAATGITGTGNTNRLALFTGAQTVADSWLLQNGSTLELDNTRNLSLTGGNFSVTGASTFSGLLTANGNLTIEAGDTFTFNGEAFTDLTGTGLSFNSGSLQTTLGTSVDLTAEVTGILPVANGGTGVNGSSAANGQLLIGNGSGYALATLSQGSGITITNGAGSITVASTLGTSIESAEITDLTVVNGDIANGTIDLSTKTTGNYVATIAGNSQVSVSGSGSNNAAVTLGLVADSIGDTQLAFNTGQHLTTSSTPNFAGLTLTGGTFTVGTVTQLASLILHDGDGQTTTLQPGNSTGNLTFTLPTADGTANQCVKTNASGALSFGDCVASIGGGGGITGSGTQNRVSKFGAGGTSVGDSTISDDGTNVTTSVDLIVQGGSVTVGGALQDAALTMYGNGFTAEIGTSLLTANSVFNLPAGTGGEFCVKEIGNCSGAGGGNAPQNAQYLTLALDAGLSAERTLSFNGTNFGVTDNGANNSYVVNTAQNINTGAAPSFAGMTFTGNVQLNANTLQGAAAVIDFSNFDVASNGNVTAGTYNGQTISSAASFTGTLAVAGLATLNGGLTVEAGDTITFNGDAFTDLTGNGLQVTSNALTIVTQASKGLEVDGSGLSLVDCTTGQILKYNGSNQWACDADAGGSGLGDDVSVNGAAATNANFVNTAASATAAGVTWTLNNVADPDEISLTVGTASATDAGIVTASGSQTFGGNKTFNGSVVVAASQSITLTGGSTGSRPGSPTEGMVYFDTDTDKLLVYSNGKWQADRTDAILVAASNSSQADKDAADYVADGNTGAAADGDQVQINAALTAASGKKVVLLAGTYVVDATILVPNSTVLTGIGAGTVIELADLDATDSLIENSDTTTGTGITIRDMKLDGRSDLNNGGIQSGIVFTGMGEFTTRDGGKLSNIWATRFDVGAAISLLNSDNNQVTGINITSTDLGIQIGDAGQNSQKNIITNSNIISSVKGIMLINGDDNKISDVETTSVSSIGIHISNGSDRNLISDNGINANGGSTDNNSIVIESSNQNQITDNRISDGACTVTCYAISIDASSSLNYLSNNTLGGTVNNLGVNTIYAGQSDSNTYTSGNYLLQPVGTIELLKNTNITGTLNITSDVDTNGSLTVGNANQFVIGNTGVVTSGTWQGTAVADTYVANDLTISSSGNVDWQALSNYPAACSAGDAITALGDSVTCSAFAAGSGSGNYIQNQNASQQGSSNFWISGTGRADTSFTTPLLDTATAAALGIGTGNANALSVSKSGVTTTVNGALTVTEAGTFNGGLTVASGLTVTQAGNVAFQRNTTNYTATGTQDDINFGSGALFRITSASALTINGIAGGADGRVISLVNASSNPVTVAHNASATPANHVTTGTGTNLTIPVGSTLQLTYDSASSVWRVVGDAADAGCSTCANTNLSNITSTNLNSALNVTSGNLQLQTTTSGDILLTPATSSGLANVLNGSLKVGNGTPDATLNGEDLYVEGTLEVDGAVRFDTALTVANGGTGASTFTQYGVLFGNGTSAVGVTAAGSTGQCLLATTSAAPSWGSCTATDLPGAYAATAVTSGAAEITLADAKGLRIIAADTSTDPSVIMKLNCTACGTGATGNFLIQNNSSAALFSVAGNGTIEIGTANNGISLSGSGGTTTGTFTLKGTARNTKTIRLLAEYPSAVLDPGSGGSNTGTMTSGYETGANRMNYYKWVTTQGTAQSYDVVVQVPIPSDFDGWATNNLTITGWRGNNANNTLQIQVIKSNGSADSNFATFQSHTALSGGAHSTWIPQTFSLDATNYTAGDYLTLRLRMQAAATSGDVRLGNIVLNYTSKF